MDGVSVLEVVCREAMVSPAMGERISRSCAPIVDFDDGAFLEIIRSHGYEYAMRGCMLRGDGVVDWRATINEGNSLIFSENGKYCTLKISNNFLLAPS